MSGIFEVMGPIMIGPSSSHTAGAVKLGRAARYLFSKKIDKALINFHGSFAATYRGHGTDRAVVGGLLGFDPDDEKIKNSLQIARDNELEVTFNEVELRDVHPNTLQIILEKGEYSLKMTGSSIGGGDIRICRIDDYQVNIAGRLPTLWIVHRDRPGMVGIITSILGSYQLNIAYMQDLRMKKGKNASSIIELDQIVKKPVRDHLRQLDDIELVRYIPPLTH
ncbi:MAG: L-serine ammonia-lyase, iron-sulfur-dependent subunit beta [Bacillota bacterium]